MTDKEKLNICIEALKELIEPSGPYDMDRHQHAINTIRETARIAQEALDKIGEPYEL